MPDDLQLLKRSVRKDDKKNLSYITQELFSVEELKKLVSTGSTIQKLIATWCLNCAHGAAEIGRVTWGDLYLDQDHPWRSQGLKIETGGSWTGFLRHKTDVVGWWKLWPETIALLQTWKREAEQILQRPVKKNDRLLITQAGEDMYKDKSKNGQSKFAKVFADHRELAKVSNMPLGISTCAEIKWYNQFVGKWLRCSVRSYNYFSSKDACHGPPGESFYFKIDEGTSSESGAVA